MTINIGKLTAEETQTLMRDCIQALTDEELFTVLEEELTAQQRDELGERWFNIDEEH